MISTNSPKTAVHDSLTLNKAIAKARQVETVAKQQSEIREESLSGELIQWALKVHCKINHQTKNV